MINIDFLPIDFIVKYAIIDKVVLSSPDQERKCKAQINVLKNAREKLFITVMNQELTAISIAYAAVQAVSKIAKILLP